MIQNFEPRQSERNFEPIEWNQNKNPHEGTNPPQDPDHTACLQPNPPWWCDENAPAVNVDIYAPMLILIALIIGLIVIRKFKINNNEKN